MPENARENRSRQLSEFAANFLQVLPLILFAQTRGPAVSDADHFAWGAGVALAVLAVLLLWRRRPHPLWTGVNVWLILSAALWNSGVPGLIDGAELLRETSLFVVSALTVCGYLLLSPRGFFDTSQGADPALCRRYSFVYLALIGGALLWALGLQGNDMLAGVLPAILLGGVYLALERRLSPGSPPRIG
tara:strand:+ start:10630 stop:11196 length:567 start_codon:yes stop_codon:yes gene_type:complete